jgi:numb
VKPSRSIETAAVERPRPSASMLLRQSSFKGFGQLADTSMFKRQSSLRINDLPSTVDRQKQLHNVTMDSSTGTGGFVHACVHSQ